MRKDSELTTAHLRLVPLSDDALLQMASAETDPHMRAAYEEMHAGCLRFPQQRLWYTAWAIVESRTGKTVGDLCFKGPPENGGVELGYGILPPYENHGYATEAAGVAVAWAFCDSTVLAVCAETEPENLASQRVLKKLKFRPAGPGKEGPRFERERHAPRWAAIYLCLGVGVAACFSVGVQKARRKATPRGLKTQQRGGAKQGCFAPPLFCLGGHSCGRDFRTLGLFALKAPNPLLFFAGCVRLLKEHIVHAARAITLGVHRHIGKARRLDLLRQRSAHRGPPHLLKLRRGHLHTRGVAMHTHTPGGKAAQVQRLLGRFHLRQQRGRKGGVVGHARGKARIAGLVPGGQAQRAGKRADLLFCQLRVF